MSCPPLHIPRCIIRGIYINPVTCLKVINHELRREILHKLYLLTIRGPISKRELAKAVGIDYHELVYQLNNHLKDFWRIMYEEKKRGAREEYIAPYEANAIYIMLGSGATIYILDPLANLYGKLAETGTRCQRCSRSQIRECLEEIIDQSCFSFSREEKERMTKMLELNGRKEPFTPLDLVVACTALRSLEGQGCIADLSRTKCNFLKQIAKESGVLNQT